MKKGFRIIAVLGLALFVLCGLAACGHDVNFTINFMVDEEIYASVSTAGAATIEMPPNPTKDGFVFDGWYWDNGTWQNPFTANSLLNAPLSDDMSVYAKFTHIHSDTDWAIAETTAATEDSVGSIIYRCSVCGATKTETIEKLPHVHVYSETWVKNETHHWHECEKDGDKSGYAEHNWNNGVVTKEATEDETGTKLFTCIDCNITKTETIEKLPHVHVYSETWIKNETHHWHECTKDGDKSGYTEHNWNNGVVTKEATEDETGTKLFTCIDCNITKTETIEKLPHVHVYSETWVKNETHHWHECEKDGDKSGYAEHNWNNGVVTKEATEYENGKIKYTCVVCGYWYEEDTPKLIIDRSGAEILAAKGFTMAGNAGYISLSNTTQTYSFINQITVSNYATWTISTDIYGMNTIVTKTIPLNIGDNTVYLLVCSGDGNNINLYTMTVRRRPMYTVTFATNGGTYVDDQTVEETYLATEPTTTRAGYTFIDWSYDFTKPIMKNETISASWTAHTDTSYRVEYYLQNLEDDNYMLTDTDNLTGTTDTTANAQIKTYEHFTYNQSASTTSGNINGDGSRVLMVYYTRDKYLVQITAGTATSISNAINGYYKYGATIDACLAQPSLIGYDWNGWYLEDEYLTNQTELSGFTVEHDVTYIAQSKIKPEMLNFVFTSTATSCLISSIRDKSIAVIFVPDYVTSISGGAFNGCSSLKSITIPFVGAEEGKTSSDRYQYPFGYIFGTSSYSGGTATKQYYYGSSTNSATYDMYYIPSSLKSVTVTGGNILYGAFYNCNGLMSVTIGNSVMSIGSSAFRGCTGLTSITIGNSVTSIGDWAFYGCTGLTSVYYTGDIASWCGISGLNCLMSSSRTLYIDGERIEGELVIPDIVTSIGSSAFYNCNGLTSITIPDNVTSIGRSAFCDCTGLTSINVASGNTKYHSNSNCLIETETKTLILGCKTSVIPSDGSVTSIGSYAFRGCTGLTSITIPDSVTSIGYDAFAYCTGLTSITIPDIVTSIGNGAFSGCSSLESITIPFIGAQAGKTSSDRYQYPFGYIFGTSSYTGGTATEQYYYGSSTSSTTYDTYYIPSSLKSVTVTGGNILYGAFYNCNGLTSITIGSGVTSIGSSAFRGCTGLTSVYYTGDIASWCGISGLNYLMSSSRTLYIDGNTLEGELVIPDSVTSIGWGAFSGCDGLTSITIPDSVTSIGSCAFYNCNGLTSITIPDSVTSIGWVAFSGCTGLTSVNVAVGNTKYHSNSNCLIETETKTLILGCKTSVIPSDGSVTSIGDYAFRGCTGLTSITIPDSVKSIGYEAFYNCNGLTSITYNGTKAQWNAISKGSGWNINTGNYKIYCTDGTLNK